MPKTTMKATLLATSLFALTSFFAASCGQSANAGVAEATTFAELKDAVANGAKAIKVGDINCAGETLKLNHQISFSPISEKATLREVYFTLEGPTTVGEKIDVSFSNIAFEGNVNLTGIDLSSPTSFEEKFGTESLEKRCISCAEGYYSLTLDGCTISGYAAETGPAIYLENENREDSKLVTLRNCDVHSNYCAYDVLHLSHVKLEATIASSTFHDNYAYKAAGFSIANGHAEVNNVQVRDNHFLPFDINQKNPQNCGGGIYYGGSSILMKDCLIARNESIYGGGLGLATPYAGDKEILVQNVILLDNKATYGGALAAFSLSGQPISFLDCGFYGNQATYGSSLYAETYARWLKDNDGGLVEFLFSSFALNKAEDTSTFSFYNEEATKGEIGTVALKGCIHIGDDTYESKDSYNYVAPLSTALEEGALEEANLEKIADQGIRPKAGSKADVSVPDSVYTTWSPKLASYSGNRTIGMTNVTPSNWTLTLLLWTSIGGALLLILILTLLFFVFPRRFKRAEDSAAIIEPVAEEEPLPEDHPSKRLESLSERELEVVKMLISGKRRRQIADELHYSENTIKKDLTAIYAKLGVADKFELILRYKPLI